MTEPKHPPVHLTTVRMEVNGVMCDVILPFVVPLGMKLGEPVVHESVRTADTKSAESQASLDKGLSHDSHHAQTE